MATVEERATRSIREIAERIAERKEELVRHMVERYREEIVDYRMADDDFLDRDVYAVSLDNLELLLATLIDDEPPADERMDPTRLSAARRIQQGISLESFLHAARLWGQITWATVLEEARADAVKLQCAALAEALAGERASVGLSGWHAGLAQIAVGYVEADEAVQIAAGSGLRGRAVAFDEVLLDHMVRSSPHGDRILDGT